MNPDERMKFKLLRISKGIKLKELSGVLGVTGNMVTMHETSKGNLSPERLKKYQEYIESK
jgi:transcriptional regulator with XRE-family HTH domain